VALRDLVSITTPPTYEMCMAKQIASSHSCVLTRPEKWQEKHSLLPMHCFALVERQS